MVCFTELPRLRGGFFFMAADILLYVLVGWSLLLLRLRLRLGESRSLRVGQDKGRTKDKQKNKREGRRESCIGCELVMRERIYGVWVFFLFAYSEDSLRRTKKYLLYIYTKGQKCHSLGLTCLRRFVIPYRWFIWWDV